MFLSIKSLLLIAALSFSIHALALALTRLELADQAVEDTIVLSKSGVIDPKFTADATELLLVLTEFGKVYDELHVFAPTLTKDNLLLAQISPGSGHVDTLNYDTLKVVPPVPKLRGLDLFVRLSSYIKSKADEGDSDFQHIKENFREYNIYENSTESIVTFADLNCLKTIVFKLDDSGAITLVKPGRCH